MIRINFVKKTPLTSSDVTLITWERNTQVASKARNVNTTTPGRCIHSDIDWVVYY